jgi:hypothetical protein
MKYVPWFSLFVFILAILKITGIAAISWWVVFAPFFLVVGFVLLFVLLALIFAFLSILLS